VFVKARVQDRFNQPGSLELKLNKIELLSDVKEKAFSTIKLRIRLSHVNDEFIVKLENLVNTRAGKSNLEFHIEDEDNSQIKLFSKKSKVTIDNEFLFELDKMAELKYELV
jgi:hypothetical protein